MRGTDNVMYSYCHRKSHTTLKTLLNKKENTYLFVEYLAILTGQRLINHENEEQNVDHAPDRKNVTRRSDQRRIFVRNGSG